jgi:hypothetical protein
VSLTAGPWPAGDSRPRSRRGPGVKPFTPDPSGPSERDPHASVRITTQGSMRGGAGRIGTRSGLDVGGAAPHNARLPLPVATTTTSTTGPPCRAPAARRARGAERERALAGGSGGASGPCRPGLKTYRKSSQPELPEMPEMPEPPERPGNVRSQREPAVTALARWKLDGCKGPAS